MSDAIVSTDGSIALAGVDLEIREWTHGPNQGPPLHVHHSDDEAWHVLDGALRFHFTNHSIDAGPGATVMAPAGVAHTYGNPGPGDVRYLIISTRRVFALIEALHVEGLSTDEMAAIFREHDSEVLG